MIRETLEEFDVVVVDDAQRTGKPYMGLVEHGLVLDFVPTEHQKEELKLIHRPLSVNTMFTVEERENASLNYLISKQVLHYIEVYGLGAPGLFNLVENTEEKVTMRYIKGMTRDEFSELVLDALYSNRPVKNGVTLKEIVFLHRVDYDINKVQNNELRVMLYRPGDVFESGDDAVRYIVYQAVGNAMLIKSREVTQNVSVFSRQYKDFVWFLAAHEDQLSRVFNRHKKIILAVKNGHTKTVINRISRYSKRAHVPLKESISKTFVSKALKGEILNLEEVLSKISVRDKFKYLNLLTHKKTKPTTETFMIRNGKVWSETGRTVYDTDKVDSVLNSVIKSLKSDLSHLKTENILLDNSVVDFGLPTTKKQAIGQLPFGTEITAVDKGKVMSAGIHWRDEWGASDLDLSAIRTDGNRVGWGSLSAFRNQEIVYSGDVTSAYDGAMEFMTSKDKDYGLMVNIYSGVVGSKAELVIGTKGEDNWIQNVKFRSEVTLDSRNSILGFVKENKFVVYKGRLNNKCANFGERDPVLDRGLNGEFWTVTKLFDVLGVQYDTLPNGSKEYKYKVDADSTFADLEKLLLT